MSSPRKSYGSSEIREGTRFVLKEITASLHNSQTSPRTSGNDSALQKSPEHAVKVQFAREFADVKKTTSPTTESLSSAGSFQSLSSTLSSKSSSGICADHLPESPLGKSANTSYINSDIPGLDDLISACADIKITNENVPLGIGDLSQDQTFSSACGDLSIIEEKSNDYFQEKEENNFKIINNESELKIPDSSIFYPPENISQQFSIENFSSIIPIVSSDESIVKSHDLNNIDKKSLVFSTALDFQNLQGFTPKIVIDDKPNIEINVPQNESIEHVNSITEFGFNASIESQKNISLIDTNNISALDTSQLPSVTNILNLTHPSENNLPHLETIKVVEESPKISNDSEKITIEEFSIIAEENIKINEEIPLNLSENFLILEKVPEESNIKINEEIVINSLEQINKVVDEIPVELENCLKLADEIVDNLEKNKEIPIESENCLKLTEEITVNLEENKEIELENCPKLIAEEIIDNLEQNKEIPIESENCLNITKEIIDNLEENKEILNNSKEIVEKISDNSEENALNSTFGIIINEDLKSPISEFINKINVTPNHSLDDENIQKISHSETEKKKSPTLQSILDKVAEQQKSLDDIELSNNNLQLEKSSEEISNKRNFHLSTIIESPQNFPSPQQEKNFPNNTIILSSEKSQKSNSFEKLLSDANNDTVDSSSEIVFLKQQTSLESTIITINGNNSAKLTPLSNDKIIDDNLKNSSLIKEKEESPKKEFESLEQTETPKRPTERSKIIETAKKIQEDIKRTEKRKFEESKDVLPELDSTIILENSEIDLEASDIIIPVPQDDNYDTFKPQKQSTDLVNIPNFSLFDKVELEAQAVAQDIYNKSLEIADDNDHFISATSDLFQDPTSFDFLLSQGSNTKSRDVRFESLYVKFDPLINNSMLPQGNSQTEDEEQNEKNETPTMPSVDTPMRNPAIAAIDRLLFFSPITTGNKTEATKDIKETSETAPQENPVVVDEKMAKELEHVRLLVVEHEEKLEKNQKDREDDKRKYQKEMKKQQDDYRNLEEKYRKLEEQHTQELESKKQVTVVLDEYERSISRLVAERERDRTELEEKEKLKEELQTATQHLSNTEAAFNDVHQKYERAKNVIAAYKSNETVLKESHKENLETIAMLEKKYDTLKGHAMAQLEKANQELETIQKQHEAENVKLQAMLKKAELKSKSLADQVEQKTIENKELTKILDEVIARVGNKNKD
ncbi:transforming acidic coiled-coil-containing protein 3 isoform X2 [Leptopilina boulardi]|uniref:transforming acidic coiled-coil-containing protein 3 isoform X2 n=1 Tax=Leptopilina boulardi TaxID=63433 RepID=UPI0021F69563|nr:transforming acidic coiled-coil-containing protein 3 isoform X2 [Leptopilina boulardi]